MGRPLNSAISHDFFYFCSLSYALYLIIDVTRRLSKIDFFIRPARWQRTFEIGSIIFSAAIPLSKLSLKRGEEWGLLRLIYFSEK